MSNVQEKKFEDISSSVLIVLLYRCVQIQRTPHLGDTWCHQAELKFSPVSWTSNYLSMSCILSYARDQWFPTYKLRICQIWTKISHQNHFSIHTLIFPWPVEFGDWAVVSGGGIKISDTTYVVCGFPLLRQCHRGISMTLYVLLDRSTWCRCYVGVTSSRRHDELGVWNSRIKSCFSVVFVA
jgi:hypothetical protein